MYIGDTVEVRNYNLLSIDRTWNYKVCIEFFILICSAKRPEVVRTIKYHQVAIIICSLLDYQKKKTSRSAILTFQNRKNDESLGVITVLPLETILLVVKMHLSS